MNKYFKKEKRRLSTFDSIVECMLYEGLITSFDIHKLKSTLKHKFKDKIKVILPNFEELTEHNFDYNAYSFSLQTKIDINEIKKVLNLFGYYINKKIHNTYQIEPKYPVKINDILKEKSIKYFYHITPNSNLKRIMKIGLAPRGSETDFYHPDDRIYLINGEGKNLKAFFRGLVQGKNLKLEDMTIFKIPYSNRYKYYLNDMATFIESYNLIAVFILQNIKPDELEIIEL